MNEKRHAIRESCYSLKRELNDDQRMTLAEIEGFGWELKFIRRPMFMDSVPVVFEPGRGHFAIIEPDGTLNERPAIEIRH
ncbi:MAG TPA: hypothetical protein VGH80_01565 [Xanthomonadaceae bacterium]|jgi:hypothetical protein